MLQTNKRPKYSKKKAKRDRPLKQVIEIKLKQSQRQRRKKIKQVQFPRRRKPPDDRAAHQDNQRQKESQDHRPAIRQDEELCQEFSYPQGKTAWRGDHLPEIIPRKLEKLKLLNIEKVELSQPIQQKSQHNKTYCTQNQRCVSHVSKIHSNKHRSDSPESRQT